MFPVLFLLFSLFTKCAVNRKRTEIYLMWEYQFITNWLKFKSNHGIANINQHQHNLNKYSHGIPIKQVTFFIKNLTIKHAYPTFCFIFFIFYFIIFLYMFVLFFLECVQAHTQQHTNTFCEFACHLKTKWITQIRNLQPNNNTHNHKNHRFLGIITDWMLAKMKVWKWWTACVCL